MEKPQPGSYLLGGQENKKAAAGREEQRSAWLHLGGGAGWGGEAVDTGHGAGAQGTEDLGREGPPVSMALRVTVGCLGTLGEGRGGEEKMSVAGPGPQPKQLLQVRE